MTDDRHLQDVPMSPAETSTHLFERWGLKRGIRTLQGYRRTGNGPAFHRVGNNVFYKRDAVDTWASQLLGEPLRNTTERSARRLMAAAAAKEG